jgi:hypothetical protein
MTSISCVSQGAVCANPCPPGSYHKDCKRRCDCYNGAVCDHVNGKCHCLPGYQGTKVTNRLFAGLEKNPVFLKNPAQWFFWVVLFFFCFFFGFLGFFWFFGVFWFFGFFWVFLPRREGFRVFSVSRILLGASRL